MENKRKHLEFIQGVINRLSTNSFLLKGWSVVLVSALFALSTPNSDTSFVFLAYFPAIIFWGLDAYFLWQEKLYRYLYNHVREQKEEAINFSMDTTPFRTEDDAPSWFGAFFSTTLIPFHGVLIAAILMVIVIQNIN